MFASFQAKIAQHFDLILTVAGVVIALALTVASLELPPEQRGVFILLVWLQGFLLWAIRRHSILSRIRLLARLRVMLQDRVNNQLTVMLAMTELGRQGGMSDHTAVERAVMAARSVSEELARLSVESLRSWEARYRDTTDLPFSGSVSK